MKNTQLPI